MEPIKVDLSGIGTLEELFQRWQEEQEKQKDVELGLVENRRQSTFPDWKCSNGRVNGCHKDFYKSFCYDGFLTDWQKGRKTILFICREANIADEKHIAEVDSKDLLLPEKTRCENRFGQFWVKHQHEQNCSRDPYIAFINSVEEEYRTNTRRGYNLAYMNLNKRGGFGSCNMARIGHYVAYYQRFIQREIELISPDIIICGGTFDTIMDIMMGNQCDLIKRLGKKELICRDFCHPAAPGGIREKKKNAVNLVTGQSVKID